MMVVIRHCKVTYVFGGTILLPKRLRMKLLNAWTHK
jgi:hypothetical protein